METICSLPISGPALVVNTSQSAIVTRKAELQAAEIMRNCQDGCSSFLHINISHVSFIFFPTRRVSLPVSLHPLACENIPCFFVELT